MQNEIIGILIMRAQPPHKGHIAMVETLRKMQVSKVMVFLTGNNHKEDRNPFSFSLRKKFIEDCLDKNRNLSPVEIFPSDTGYLINVVKNNIINYNRYKYICLVGNDRAEKFKTHLQGIHSFDIDLLKIEDVVYDNKRISGTDIRNLIIQDEKEKVKELCCASLLSTRKFNSYYNEFRKGLGLYFPLQGNILHQLTHIEKLNEIKSFEYFIDKLLLYQYNGKGLEVSEKMDGCCQVSFGIKDDKLYISPKGKEIFYSEEECTYDIFKEVFRIIKSLETELRSLYVVPKNDEYITENFKTNNVSLIPKNAIYPQYFAEIIHKEYPNVIRYYNKNYLVFYNVFLNGYNIPDNNIRDFFILNLIDRIGRTKKFESVLWNFEKKNIIDHKLFKNVDILTPKILYTDEKLKVENRKELVRNKLYDDIVNVVVRNINSNFASRNIQIEGIVIEDLKTGKLTKVTDSVFYKKASDFIWNYRERVLDGYTPIDGEFIPGFRMQFFKSIAKLTGIKPLHSKNLGKKYIIDRIKKIKENYSVIIRPNNESDLFLLSKVASKSKNTQLNFYLKEFLKKENISTDKEEFINNIEYLISEKIIQIIELKEEWKNSPRELLLEDNNIKYKVVIDDVIENKTNSIINLEANWYIDLVDNITGFKKYVDKLNKEDQYIFTLKIILNKCNLMKGV